MSNSYFILICLCVTTLAYMKPSRPIPKSWFENEVFFRNHEEDGDLGVQASNRQDQEEAPTNENHHGRVQIKVYRGPDSQDEHEHFAPYGFWVKQPADNHRR